MQRYLEQLLVKLFICTFTQTPRLFPYCETFLSTYKDTSNVMNPSTFFCDVEKLLCIIINSLNKHNCLLISQGRTTSTAIKTKGFFSFCFVLPQVEKYLDTIAFCTGLEHQKKDDPLDQGAVIHWSQFKLIILAVKGTQISHTDYRKENGARCS